jgi:uncharacterized protein YdbL (DUF1318 family)
MKKLTTLLAACLLLISQTAFAIDLQTAKSQGLVGETTSGYLEAVKAATAETNALIQEINQKRKKKYMEIAARNNISLKDVEELAGKKAIEKSEAGSYVKIRDTWKKK